MAPPELKMCHLFLFCLLTSIAMSASVSQLETARMPRVSYGTNCHTFLLFVFCRTPKLTTVQPDDAVMTTTVGNVRNPVVTTTTIIPLTSLAPVPAPVPNPNVPSNDFAPHVTQSSTQSTQESTSETVTSTQFSTQPLTSTVTTEAPLTTVLIRDPIEEDEVAESTVESMTSELTQDFNSTTEQGDYYHEEDYTDSEIREPEVISSTTIHQVSLETVTHLPVQDVPVTPQFQTEASITTNFSSTSSLLVGSTTLTSQPLNETQSTSTVFTTMEPVTSNFQTDALVTLSDIRDPDVITSHDIANVTSPGSLTSESVSESTTIKFLPNVDPNEHQEFTTPQSIVNSSYIPEVVTNVTDLVNNGTNLTNTTNSTGPLFLIR